MDLSGVSNDVSLGLWSLCSRLLKKAGEVVGSNFGISKSVCHCGRIRVNDSC